MVDKPVDVKLSITLLGWNQPIIVMDHYLGRVNQLSYGGGHSFRMSQPHGYNGHSHNGSSFPTRSYYTLDLT